MRSRSTVYEFDGPFHCRTCTDPIWRLAFVSDAWNEGEPPRTMKEPSTESCCAAFPEPWMRTVTALELHTAAGRTTSTKFVPTMLLATGISAPAPALMNTFTPVTPALALHATRREPPSVARAARPGVKRTRALVAIVKFG